MWWSTVHTGDVLTIFFLHFNNLIGWKAWQDQWILHGSSTHHSWYLPGPSLEEPLHWPCKCGMATEYFISLLCIFNWFWKYNILIKSIYLTKSSWEILDWTMDCMTSGNIFCEKPPNVTEYWIQQEAEHATDTGYYWNHQK